MLLASLMYFAHYASLKKWNAEIPTNYPFEPRNIDEMINCLNTRQVMCRTNMTQCDFIGINIVPYNKNLSILKLAFVHIAGEHYRKITNGKTNQQLELLLKCSTFANPTFFLITPYKSFEEHLEDELHSSFINHLKANMPKIYKIAKIYVIVSQWDKNMEDLEITKYLELYRPKLFNSIKNNKQIIYGEYSIGNVIELSKEPFQYVTHINSEYPNSLLNFIYKSYTNKNLK